MDGPDNFTAIADIGEFSIANPPSVPIDVPSGLQFALESYRGGFLVTDRHHNRVLRVTLFLRGPSVWSICCRQVRKDSL